jgi:tyrosyl-tRNA synthetase
MDSHKKAIEEIIFRGVEDILVKESLIQKLNSGKKLRIKLGFDPTSKYVHIGRAITLWKLRAFQDLGHTVVFIVGDFTAMIGDPSDKLSKRPMLTKEQIEENLKTYKEQISKIIDLSKAEFYYNSEWLSKLTFTEIINLAESFTVGQMIERRNFKERFENKEEISLREFLYPLMQGYDSVMVKSDVEIGGFDQLFNLKAGRVIQKFYKMPEQDVLTTQMLEGTDGRKMSSSWGNIISIVDDPKDMYGKVMSLRDELIEKYFVLCTRLSIEDIQSIISKVKDNPKDIKMHLAREIVTLYHGADLAQKAEEFFIDTFSKGKIPEDIQNIKCKTGDVLSDILVNSNIVSSKTEWRRLVQDGSVSILESEEKIQDVFFKIDREITLRIGKKRFVKIVID